MSRVALPTRAFNDRRIRGSHLRVLAAVAMLNAGELSHKEIGAECGITGRDLRRELQELADFEYLSIEGKDGTKSVYVIQYNELEGGDKSSPPGEKNFTPTLVLVPPEGPPPLPPAPPKPTPPIPPSPSKAARASRLPEDWMPSQGNLAYAGDHGFSGRDLSALIQDFRDYWHARAGPNALKVDWSKTWARWVRTAAERRDDKHGRSHRKSPHDAETAAFAWAAGGADDREPDSPDDAPLLDAAGAF